MAGMPDSALGTRVARRAMTVLIVIVVLAAAADMLHESFRSLSITPALAVDDSIPNVAIALGKYGRYGFLSSPTQGPQEVDRTHAFYNYGPSYFYVAAALTWLVGPSLLMYRMLHPMGLVLIVVVSLWAFKRWSLAGSALLALVLFDRYMIEHRPIARPDIAVSVSVVLMLIFAAWAIERGGWWNWSASGFFAVNAFTSHQVALALVPVAGLIWLAVVVIERRDDPSSGRRAVTSALALTAGGAVAALVFLLAIDFRFHDLWVLDIAGARTRAQPFLPTLKTYFALAWSSLDSKLFTVLLALFGTAVLLVASAPWLAPSRRRQVLAFVMPPVVAAAVYQLSLGLFGGVTLGYVILSQVTTAWAAGACVALLAAWARESRTIYGNLAELAVAGVAVWTLGTVDVQRLSGQASWRSNTLGLVDFTDYLSELKSPLPERAAVWGSLSFGTDDRIDLVQFQQAFNPALDIRQEDRARVAPDFLVLGSYEFADAFALTLIRQDSALRNFFRIFPDSRYRMVKLVSAPPYGTSLVYQRVTPGTDPGTSVPMVAVNDGSSRQWSSQLSEPIAVKFQPADGVTAEFTRYAIHTTQPPLSAQSALLPAGFYLIEIAVEKALDEQTGFILASRSAHFVSTDDGPPITPYLVGEREVQILVDHLGGPLFLSRYEGPIEQATVPPAGARFDVRSIRRVMPLRHVSGDVASAPPVRDWTLAKDVALTPVSEAGIRASNSTGGEVTISSPAIPAVHHPRIMLTAEVDGDRAVTVGVLSRNGSWLAAPVVMPRRISFDTAGSDDFRIVIASAGAFVVRDVPKLMTIVPGQFYVDRVMACRSPYIPRSIDCFSGEHR